MLKKWLIIFMLFPVICWASPRDTIPISVIYLDSVVITAVRQGLDINDLLEIMQYDSTLYIAFNQLHFANYTYTNHLKAFNRKSKLAAERRERIKQEYVDQCRKQEILERTDNGDFQNRKGNDRFYTAELFDKTLYSKHPICNESPKTNWKDYLYNTKSDGHLGAIKKVIFNPGTPVDLPLIGNKFALFDKGLEQFYDYAIERKMINDEECFVFSVLLKPEHQATRKDVIVRKLVTAFRRKDFQIIQRDYEMLYRGAAVKMDIKMRIDLEQVGNQTYPKQIDYDGFYNVPTKKPERIKFVTDFYF